MLQVVHDDYREIDHSTGATIGREAAVASLERLLHSQDPFLEFKPIATLGSSLSLAVRRTGASGLAGNRYDVGVYEHVMLHLWQVHEGGQVRHSEVFQAVSAG